jgi:hypothetical protein
MAVLSGVIRVEPQGGAEMPLPSHALNTVISDFLAGIDYFYPVKC